MIPSELQGVFVFRPSSKPRWDCRWPDPVALKVASDRLLAGRPIDDPTLNRRLGVTVRMESPGDGDDPVHAILVTPWAVERVFWHLNQPGSIPPVRYAAELDLDTEGRIAAGQGVILETRERTYPVVIAWEPETGHHFIQTLLHQVLEFRSVDEAIGEALGVHHLARDRRSLTDQLQRKVSRRGMFRLSSLLKTDR
ncbi:MAG: hypothetical protein HQL76_10905 [Magnetococcales bacterium]|nr:hypothetical protein [Magnetococcales bacterium]